MTSYNLKGFFVGNGATDWNIDGGPIWPEVAYNFNLITKEVYDAFRMNKCEIVWNNIKQTNNKKECDKLIGIIYKAMAWDMDIYD